MAGWKDTTLRLFGPSWLAGITPLDWLLMLAQNGFRVSPRYWGRAATITGLSLVNAPFRLLDTALFEHRIRQVKVEAPLFVLGHYRSGTTHLHNLLSVDKRFCSPNYFQISFPHTFLSAERIAAWLLDLTLPKHRVMDKVAASSSAPYEDEWGMCALSFMSPYLSEAFPRRQEYYDRYLTFRDVPQAEIDAWKQALMRFFQRLTYKHQRQLILKSPPHTGRIRLLLEMFPDARFVHIHRDPYTVFQSTRHLWTVAQPYLELHHRPAADIEERVFRQYREMYDAFFEERHLIPAGRFFEVGFDDLEKDPIGQVQRIYKALNLPDLAEVEPQLREYVGTLSGYKKNRHSDLPAETKQRIAREWRRSFEEWGYPIDDRASQEREIAAAG